MMTDDAATSRRVEEIIAEAQALIDTSRRAIDDGRAAKELGERAITLKKLVFLSQMMEENRHLFPDSESFRAVRRNFKALREEVHNGTPIDPEIVDSLEKSLTRLAERFGVEQ